MRRGGRIWAQLKAANAANVGPVPSSNCDGPIKSLIWLARERAGERVHVPRETPWDPVNGSVVRLGNVGTSR